MPCSSGSTRAPGAGLQAELRPDRTDLPADLRVHDDRTTPPARRFAGPFIGGVDAELRTEPRYRAREAKVVDRSVLDQRGGARRTHPRGDRPDHLLPVAHVDVVVADDDELRVHEL